jgi:hypothetical protein
MLGWDISHNCYSLLWYSSAPPGKCWDSILIRSQLRPSKSFPIYQSSYHLMLESCLILKVSTNNSQKNYTDWEKLRHVYPLLQNASSKYEIVFCFKHANCDYVFEITVMRIFGSMKEDVAEGRRKLHEELHSLYSSSHVFTVMHAKF